MDSHFVKTEDLAQVMRQYIDKHGRERLIMRMRVGKTTPTHIKTVGEWKLISRILNDGHNFTELKTADRILTAIDRNYLIDGGHLEIYTSAQTRSVAAPARPSRPDMRRTGHWSPETADGLPGL